MHGSNITIYGTQRFVMQYSTMYNSVCNVTTGVCVCVLMCTDVVFYINGASATVAVVMLILVLYVVYLQRIKETSAGNGYYKDLCLDTSASIRLICYRHLKCSVFIQSFRKPLHS